MKVLWVTNIILPPAAAQLHLGNAEGGGWLYSSLQGLQRSVTQIEFAVASIYGGEELRQFAVEGVTYYLLPLKGNNIQYHAELEPLWRQVIADFAPDLVHLHGTEFAHGLALLNACPSVATVVSIQGLVSIIQRYYMAGISCKERLTSLTIHDLIRRTTFWHLQRLYRKRGDIEKQILRRVSHVIGRTAWDKAHVWVINPHAEYHFCNETLRPAFYAKRWSYNECEPYSIFISQGSYPVKGLHQLLKAVALVKRFFPNVKVYIAGRDVTDHSTFRKRLGMTGYGCYLKRLINKLKLADSVRFTGSLNEEQMCARFLKSNLFVSASSIENSPNSLGEAQLLGMPCLASFVGGAPDMMAGNEENLYRFEEVEMLAQKICSVFAQKGEVVAKGREQALMRHDSVRNTQQLISIYKKICNQ